MLVLQGDAKVCWPGMHASHYPRIAALRSSQCPARWWHMICGASCALHSAMWCLRPAPQPSAPLTRSSFRKRKRSAEERKAEREAEQATMAAFRKSR